MFCLKMTYRSCYNQPQNFDSTWRKKDWIPKAMNFFLFLCSRKLKNRWKIFYVFFKRVLKNVFYKHVFNFFVDLFDFSGLQWTETCMSWFHCRNPRKFMREQSSETCDEIHRKKDSMCHKPLEHLGRLSIILWNKTRIKNETSE